MELRRCGRLLAAAVALAAALVVADAGMAFGADPVVGAAGDIACDPTDANYNGGAGTATACRQRLTSDILLNGGFDAVIALGDNQYNSGSLANYQASYDPSWGRVKAKTHPAIGNHEGTSATGGAGYCSYFGAAAHCVNGRQGNAAFYSWNIGTWHVVVLNSNCTAAGGCDVGSAQYSWLSNDLAASTAKCTLAYWHHPRFSSGHDGSNVFMQPIWKLLYDRGADVVLSGHSHDYERFAPMDGNGLLNRADGMRQFVVGTGGAFFTGLGTRIANSEAGQNNTFGVLKLTLHPSGYDYSFMPAGGQLFTDSGSDTCRGPGPVGGDAQAPSKPGTLSATAGGPTQVNLAWGASTDDVGVTGYDVLRRQGTAAFASVGTATGTTFTDTSVAAGQSYDYIVRARDASGKVSPDSNIASVATPAAGGGSTLTFAPDADASVKEASAAANFGASTSLNSDSGAGVAMESYLRFTVRGVGTASVQSAKLRLFVPSDGTADGPGVYGCTVAGCGTWTESAITWGNRPARATSATRDVGAIAAGTTVEWDVTPLVSGDGTFTVVVGPTPTTDGVVFSSREAAGNKPQLVVTTG